MLEGVTGAFLGAIVGVLVGPLVPRVFDYLINREALRETDRDVLLDDITSSLDMVLDSCERYWLSTGGDPEADDVFYARIVAGLHHVNMMLIELFPDEREHRKKCREEWTALHQVATGGEFGSPDRPRDPRRLVAIQQDGLTLKRGVRLRRKKLPRRMFGHLRS